MLGRFKPDDRYNLVSTFSHIFTAVIIHSNAKDSQHVCLNKIKQVQWIIKERSSHIFSYLNCTTVISVFIPYFSISFNNKIHTSNFETRLNLTANSLNHLKCKLIIYCGILINTCKSLQLLYIILYFDLIVVCTFNCSEYSSPVKCMLINC